MRTNVILNDDLVREAQRYSTTKSKSALIEEALQTLIRVRAQERARQSYASRARQVQQKLQDERLRDSGADLIRQDRERP